MITNEEDSLWRHAAIEEPGPARVAASTDAAELTKWYAEHESFSSYLKARVDAHREGMGQHINYDFLRKTSDKVGYLRIALRAIEARMISLGIPVPYPPSDPRSRELRKLEGVNRRYKQMLRAAGIDPNAEPPESIAA